MQMKIVELSYKDKKGFIKILKKIKIPKDGLLVATVGNKDIPPTMQTINEVAESVNRGIIKSE